MITWLKRGLLCIVLSAVLVFVVLYFWSVALLEAVLQPQLEARGGELEIESIRLNLDGLELRIQRYEDAELVAKGLMIRCPWSQLGAIRTGLVGTVFFEELRLRLKNESAEATEAEALSPADRVAAIAAQIDAWPLSSLDILVYALVVERPGHVMRYVAELTALRGASGETHIAASIEDEDVALDVRIKVSEGGTQLALDFVAATGNWHGFQRNYLNTLSDQLAARRAEFYFNPLDEGHGFLDISGYARWDAERAEALSYTVLADLGEGELYFPEGELILQRTSVGLASDGMGHQRAYAKGAIDSIRRGSWMQSGRDWALRIDGSKLVAELRVGDSLSLSFGHDDWAQLIDGAGQARFYLDASAVDAEWLRAWEIEQLPEDLALDMALELEGEGVFENWQVSDLSVGLNAQVATVSVASTGLSAANIDVQTSLRISEAGLLAESLDLNVESLDLLGFVLNDFNVSAETDEQAQIVVLPVRADFIGGTLRINPIRMDPVQMEGTPFRIGLESVELSQLAKAVPQFKGDISGKVSGYLVGEIKGGQPILTDGRLEVDPEVGARLSYDVKGLLTRGMAEGSPAYTQYRMAELAFEDLALKRFRIDVFPDGNATQPFRLELFGESLQDGTVVPVDFNVNVNVDDTAGLLELLRMIQRGELQF